MVLSVVFILIPTHPCPLPRGGELLVCPLACPEPFGERGLRDVLF